MFSPVLMRSLRFAGAALAATLTLPESALAQEVLFEVEGQQALDLFGATVSDAGDVDADGHDDVVVGAFGYNNLGPRAEVYSGRTGVLIRTFPVLDFASATGAGDVDGDGHADILVGDTGDSTNGPFSGRATVFSGRTGNVLFTFLGKGEKDGLGTFVSDVGDVNGDGRPDVAAGAPESRNPGDGPGYVRVFSGLDGSLLHEFTGDADGDGFAIVSGAGDVDADGHSDIIVGAPWADGNGSFSGFARVLSGKTGAILHNLVGDKMDALGSAVSAAGDVDLDGHADFMVGIPGANNFQGEVRVYSGASGSVIYTFFGGGYAISDAGDVDGDGFPDLIVAQNVFSGQDGSLLFTVQGPDLGGVVSGAGDVNNDNFADVILGVPCFSGTGHETGKFIVVSGVTDGEDIGTNYCGPANFNSTGQSAVISAFGSTQTSENSVTLTASQLPQNVFGYFLNSDVKDFKPFPPGSKGNLCLGGGIGRHVKQIANTGAAGKLVIPVDLTALPRPNGTHSVVAGETWNFQCWFRDNQGGPTSNFTDGISILFN